MSVQFITGATTTTQTIGTSGAIHVLTGGSVALIVDHAIQSSALTSYKTDVYIDGTVAAGHSAKWAISLSGTHNGLWQGNGQHGINVGETGIVSAAVGNAIEMHGNQNTLLNSGQINARNVAVWFEDGSEHVIRNFGSIQSKSSVALYFNQINWDEEQPHPGVIKIFNTGVISGVQGIHSRKAPLDLVNQGEIVSTGSQGNAAIIAFADTVGSTINNSGTIRSAVSDGYDGSNGRAFALGAGDDTITNSGEIFGLISLSFGMNRVVNSGFIDGNIVNSVSAQFSMLNTGTVAGDVHMTEGNDVFDGRDGTVTGVVVGFAGDDTYFVSDRRHDLQENAAEGIDHVHAEVNFRLASNFENLTLLADAKRGIGNELDNTINGNLNANRLRGKAGEDVLNGAEGNDRLFGQAGNDTLNGGDGDDVLKGGKARDKLYGNDGDDRLLGGGYKDRLYGGDGDDRLIGGRGKDELYGEDGADAFVFRRIEDSKNNIDADNINDFVKQQDVIDLAQLSGTQSFIGTSAFSGVAGEVQVTVVGADSVVLIDVNGDMIADMKINVLGVIGLGESDFVL